MYFFSLFLTAATFLLILAGGLVTSHEAGLAVPDWPLSYGQAFPPMVGNIFWEHGHRMIAGTVGILTLLLALWIQIAEKQTWIKRLAWIAFGAVVLQALLGGLTVLYLLPAPISIFHACLAQAFFCLVIAIAFFLRPVDKVGAPLAGARTGRGQAPPLHSDQFKLKRLSCITVGVIYAQLILGATVRHTSSGHAVVAHVVLAFAVMVHVFMLAGRIMRLLPHSALFKPAVALGFLTMTQFFLGIGSFVLTRMIEQSYAPSKAAVFMTATHQTNGAVILGATVLIALMVSR